MMRPLKAVWCGLAVSAVGFAAEVVSVPPLLPAEDFARADITSELALSRDGRTIAYASGLDREWLLILREWETGKTRDFGNGAGPATPRWTSGERLWFGQGASMDRDGRHFEAATPATRMALETRVEGDRAGDILSVRFDAPLGGRKQLYYVPAYPHVDWVNLRVGRPMEAVHNPGNVTRWLADGAGLVRIGVEMKEALSRVLWRDRADGEWRVPAGLDFARDEFHPLRLSGDGETLTLARRTPGGTWGLYNYDLKAGRMGEAILSHDRYDLWPEATRVFAPRTRELLGVYFHTETPRSIWLDPAMGALQKAIDQALPGQVNQITSLSDDLQHMIVLSTTARDPGTYYQFDRATQALKALFPRRPWLKPAQMAEVFPASFKARDGATIRGYLTVPLGRAPKNLPLVVWAHDGPLTRETWKFDAELQFLANRGYAVLTVNYRGSAGYGRDFQEAATRHLSTVPQDDLADGARWAITQGIADANRVALAGRGWGGTCALLGQTREPGLYRCGISIDGVTDWATHLENRRQVDPAGIALLIDRVGHPERDAAELRQASPLHSVDKLATPVLLIYSNGERVARDDSRGYRSALERGKKAHDVLSKEDDAEGFASTAARAELLLRLEQFLARNLGAGGARP